jgi:hypothetical protein
MWLIEHVAGSGRELQKRLLHNSGEIARKFCVATIGGRRTGSGRGKFMIFDLSELGSFVATV